VGGGVVEVIFIANDYKKQFVIVYDVEISIDLLGLKIFVTLSRMADLRAYSVIAISASNRRLFWALEAV
jgi:hypothetical protein